MIYGGGIRRMITNTKMFLHSPKVRDQRSAKTKTYNSKFYHRHVHIEAGKPSYANRVDPAKILKVPNIRLEMAEAAFVKQRAG